MPEVEEFGEIVLREQSQGWVDLGSIEDYHWVGGDYVFLNGQVSQEQSEVQIGPYILREVPNFVEIEGRRLFIREETQKARWAVKSFVRKIHRRIIHTLEVWNLAWVPFGEEPSWKHIYLLRSISETVTEAGRSVVTWAKNLFSKTTQEAT